MKNKDHKENVFWLLYASTSDKEASDRLIRNLRTRRNIKAIGGRKINLQTWKN